MCFRHSPTVMPGARRTNSVVMIPPAVWSGYWSRRSTSARTAGESLGRRRRPSRPPRRSRRSSPPGGAGSSPAGLRARSGGGLLPCVPPALVTALQVVHHLREARVVAQAVQLAALGEERVVLVAQPDGEAHPLD